MTDVEQKAKSKFMTKYYSNPEYKAKHQAHMLTHVPCECGNMVLRCNASKHRKSPLHLKLLFLQNQLKIAQEIGF